MKLKKLIVLLAILIAAMAVAAIFLFPNFFSKFRASTQIQIQDKQITYDSKPLKINIVYPQIAGLDDFNQKAKAIVEKELNDFKNNSLANDATVKEIDPVSYAKYPREYDLSIGYDKGEIDNNIISVIFNVYNFEGGAHGASYFVPLNYNSKLKQEIKLADFFSVPTGLEKDYLKKISDFCIEDLTKQMIEKLGSTDGTWVYDGAGPKEENFSFFLINKDNLIFYFPQYQIAYGAAGDFKVIMPR